MASHHLELEAPPVAERAAAGPVGGHLLGHLVTLKNVLERGDFHVERLERAHRREDLILAVAVAMNEAVAVEDLDDRVELEVAADGHPTLLLVFLASPAVVLCRPEAVGEDLLHAHAGLRVAGGKGVAPVGLLDVLAEGELDALGRAVELERFWADAPAELDDLVLPADRVGRAVEDVGGGGAAGELAVDGDVVGVDEVADADFRGNGLGAFVDAAVGGDVGVGVDEAGGDVQTCQVVRDASHVLTIVLV